MENIAKEHIIMCPYCGREYFPSEIFIPKDFLGTACHIEDNLYFGKDMDLTESYTCDSCNNIFTVAAKVTFSSKKSKINTFNEDF
jgi:transposase-like protein